MPRRLELRAGRPDDLDAILRIGAAFHAESWYRDCDFSFAKASDLFTAALTQPNMFGIVCVDAETDRPVGYLLAVAAEHYFGHDIMVTDLGLYILPEWRNPMAARAMIGQMEAWARKQNAKEIMLGVSSGIADEAIVRFYTRLGYTKGFYGVSKKSR